MMFRRAIRWKVRGLMTSALPSQLLPTLRTSCARVAPAAGAAGVAATTAHRNSATSRCLRNAPTAARHRTPLPAGVRQCPRPARHALPGVALGVDPLAQVGDRPAVRLELAV